MTEILNQPMGASDLTPDELKGLKVPGITTHRELNEVEAVNIEQGLLWLDQRPRTFDLLTDDAAKEIHLRLFGGVWKWAGEYRQTGKNIGVNVGHISTEMRYCLDDARMWLDREVYPLPELLARFHHRLVKIHPYPNGNGRWSRIMTDELLRRIDDDRYLNWSRGGSLQTENTHRRRYIDALRAADQYNFDLVTEFIGDALE